MHWYNFLDRHSKAVFCACLYISYILLHQLSAFINSGLQLYELASWIYLPAFVRLLGVLLIGIWVVPVLFLAMLTLIALGWYDIGPGQHVSEIWIALFTSIGGPLGAYLAWHATSVTRDLSALTAPQLLWMSAGCSLGNVIAHCLAFHSSTFVDFGIEFHLVIFFGDTFGIWAMIYLTKFIITAWGRAIK